MLTDTAETIQQNNQKVENEGRSWTIVLSRVYGLCGCYRTAYAKTNKEQIKKKAILIW